MVVLKHYRGDRMKIYKHKDYEEYYEAQVRKNKGKLKHVWVRRVHINWMMKHVKDNIPDPKFGICHGVRNGWEVEAFRKALDIEVIGTDIAPTVNDFSNCIEWDFHNIKEEWVDNVDFIYTNSFDHSNNHEHCLDQWMRCIKQDGVCFIHWNYENWVTPPDAGDCFSASKKEYKNFFNKKYRVVNQMPGSTEDNTIFVIKCKENK